MFFSQRAMWWVLRHRIDIENQLLSQHQPKFMNKAARHLRKNMHSMLSPKKYVLVALFVSWIHWSVIFIKAELRLQHQREQNREARQLRNKELEKNAREVRTRFVYLVYLVLFLSDKFCFSENQRMQLAAILNWIKVMTNHRRRMRTMKIAKKMWK